MALVAVVMFALVGAGYVGRGLVDADDTSGTLGRSPTSSGTGQASTPLVPGNEGEPVKAVAKALGPSVVVIRAGDGLGSGVIYDGRGLVLTNAHVVGRRIGRDGHPHRRDQPRRAPWWAPIPPPTSPSCSVDAPSELAAARLAGEPARAGRPRGRRSGSPFGLDQTITSGIVSAVNRPVESGTGAYVNMIQTDAAINPGNSGGALANRLGRGDGHPSMIYSQSGDSSGIGFAIPIDRAKAVADRLVAGQPLDRAFLGVEHHGHRPTARPAPQVASVVAGSAAAAGRARGRRRDRRASTATA